MHKNTKMWLAIWAAAALCAGGCSKQQVIRQDQMIPPAAPAATVLPEKPEAKPEAKTETGDAGLAAVKVNESPVEQAPAARGVTETVLKQALEKVFFDFDSYTLSAEARQALTKNAEILKQKEHLKVQIEGNCDEMGSDDYNLALGEKRASAASSYLQTMGISADRLSIISYGKERPADAGHDDSARAKNRRDEFVISSK